ncbi:MAG: 50S ribosomal protein L17 [Taibaiella sp.]|nr:50S ribosomal protein L17 [Taibaiella sp.]
MRHGDKIKNLGRTASHRAALLSNLTCQLIQYKRLTTTLAKAKSLRVYAEPIITRSKTDNMHNRRVVFSYLQDKEAIKELFGTIGDKVSTRPGGYTRIIKLQPRAGDAAEMAMIELVDFNEIYTKDGKAAGAKKTRRGRRPSTATPKQAETATAPVAATATESAPEAPAHEASTEENNA